jgi:hypothetical protein
MRFLLYTACKVTVHVSCGGFYFHTVISSQSNVFQRKIVTFSGTVKRHFLLKEYYACMDGKEIAWCRAYP